MFSLVLSHSSSGPAKHKWHHQFCTRMESRCPHATFLHPKPHFYLTRLSSWHIKGKQARYQSTSRTFYCHIQPCLLKLFTLWQEWFGGDKWQHHSAVFSDTILSPSSSSSAGGSLRKINYVLDSFPFLSACKEVVDSSTFFESNQEYLFFLESLLPGMNAKELVLLLSCDWSWITLNCFCSFIGHAGWILVRVIKLLPWQRRNSSWVVDECHRKEADLGVLQDLSFCFPW